MGSWQRIVQQEGHKKIIGKTGIKWAVGKGIVQQEGHKKIIGKTGN